MKRAAIVAVAMGLAGIGPAGGEREPTHFRELVFGAKEGWRLPPLLPWGEAGGRGGAVPRRGVQVGQPQWPEVGVDWDVAGPLPGDPAPEVGALMAAASGASPLRLPTRFGFYVNTVVPTYAGWHEGPGCPPPT